MQLFDLLAKLTLDATEFNSDLDAAQQAANDFSVPDDNKLSLDTQEFTSGIDEAETKGNEFAGSLKEVFEGIKGTLVATGIVGIIGKTVGFLREGVDVARKNGDAIDKGSQKLNLSTKAYQELGYALELSGSNIDALSRGMRNFTEIQGGKITEDQAAAFEKLGISAEKASSGVMSAEDLLNEVMYSLADYQGEDRGLLTEAFFGKNSQALNALLNSGSENIKKMREEAEEYGLVMSDDQVKAAAAYADSITRMESAVTGLKQELGSGLLPTLTDITNAIAKIIAFFGGGSKEKSLSEMFGDTDNKLSGDLLTIEETAAAANSLADKLLSMGDTSQMTAEQYAIWKGTAEELISLVPTLGKVIDTETGQINGNTTSIQSNIAAWEQMAKQKALAQAKEEKYGEIVNRNKSLINKQIEVNTKLAEIDGKRATAMKLMNEYLSDETYGEERRGLAGFDQVTEQNFDEAAKRFSNFMYQSSEAGKAVKAYTDSQKDLESLNEQAASLAEELAKGQQEFEDWSAAADQLFGTVSDDAGTATTAVSGLQSALDGLPNEKHITISIDQLEADGSNAKGSWSVPYDNYLANLHRDEMVLTASQARRYREGQGGGGLDAGLIRDLILEVRDLRNRPINMDGESVASKTTGRVRKNMNTIAYNQQKALGG